MDEEKNAIEKNKIWELVDLPKGKEVIGVKWVYKTKSNVEGKIERHRPYLLSKATSSKKEETMRKILHQLQEWRQ